MPRSHTFGPLGIRDPRALTPSERNPKLHPEEQVEQIAASISEFGFTIPILVDEANRIIAGHGRHAAALKLDLSSVPVLVAQGWSEAQKRAYIIADNKLTENGGWDETLLGEELQELIGEGFDVGLTGFSTEEIDKLIGGEPEPAQADESESSVDRIYMKIGSKRIALSDKEHLALLSLVDDYVSRTGSDLGFASEIISRFK